MSGIQLDYHIDVEQAVRAFQALAYADRHALASTVGEMIVTETILNFDRQQTPEGTPWTPSQRAIETGDKTLTDHAHLRDSVTYLVSADNNVVEVGSNLEYAAIHQFGGEAGRNKSTTIEARPFLGLTAELQLEIADTVINFYDEVLDVY